MSDTISFETGTDTGEAQSDAVQPYDNRERAHAAVFNRPIENLRERTEVLRAEVNYQRAVRDLDRATVLTLVGVGGLTWGGTSAGGGTGQIDLGASTSLRSIPMLSPGTTRSGAFENSGAVYPGRLAHFDVVDSGNTFRVISDKEAWEGGNEITLSVTDSPGAAAIAVVVAGNSVVDPAVQPGIDDIAVTYDSLAGHTIAAVLTAINTHPTAGSLVTVSLPVGSSADPMFDIVKTPLAGGLDGVYHDVSTANLAAFWAASADNLLKEGDTLGIWYASAALRRQSTEEAGNAAIPAASLVNLSREPEKAGNAVVLGKIVDDVLILASGQAILKDVTVTTLGSDSGLRTDLAKPLSSPPAAGTNTYGSEIVGINPAPLTYVTTAEGDASVQAAFGDIDAAIAATDSDVASNAADITALQTSSTFATPYLWDADNVVDVASASRLVQLRSSTSQNKARYARYNAALLDGSVFSSKNASALSRVDVCGEYIHVWDGTDYAQIELETGDDYFSTAVASVIDMSSNGSYTALLQDGGTSGTRNVIIYPNGSSSPVSVGVGTLSPGNGIPLGVVVRADNYVWVLFHEEVVSGDFRWYCRAYAADSGSVAVTLEMAAGTASSDYVYHSLDAAADIVGCVMEDGVIGGDPINMFIQQYNHASGTYSRTVHSVGDTITGTLVKRMIFMEEVILLGGREILANQVDVAGIGGGNGTQLAAFSRQDPDVMLYYAANIVTHVGNAGDVFEMYADGDRVYVVAEDDTTGDQRTVVVYDNRLQVVTQMDYGSNTIRALSDGQFFWILDATGDVVQHFNDVTGSLYQFDAIGRAPGWTRHTKIGHGK